MRWVFEAAVELRDENGVSHGSIGMYQDISARKHAEEEIQQLNAELENKVKERTAQLNEANQNLHQEKVRLEQYSRQRELMGTMTDLLQASLTTDEASGIVSRYMKLLFPNRDGALYLLNASGTLEPIAVWGEQKSLDTMFGMNDCWALRRGRPYRFGSGSPNPPCAHVGKEITQSALCIPLAAQGESMGSLHISTESIGEGGLMDDEEQRFIETIADSVALALANVRLRERLRIQSIRDGLTGLFNRRYLDETLPREIHRAERNQRPISVLMFDLDSFKKVNDTYGHDAGDMVLKRIAEILTTKIRPSDIACRYGGEEFTVILPDTSLEVAHARAEGLREVVSQTELQHNGKNLGTITISMGVATYPQHGITRDALIKAADEASYQAKQTGKNRVVLAISK
jgi:diguanylate cyclase (GGDEF)-like protein